MIQKKPEYYQQPQVVILEPHDEAFAFTMRLLNLLRSANIIKSQPNQFQVDYYARRMLGRRS